MVGGRKGMGSADASKDADCRQTPSPSTPSARPRQRVLRARLHFNAPVLARVLVAGGKLRLIKRFEILAEEHHWFSKGVGGRWPRRAY